MPKKILIVDDEQEVRELVKDRLEANGYDVILAANGAEGLTKAEESSPDIIFLDIILPDIDGFEVLQKIKNNEATAGIPIIMLTVKGETKSLIKATDLGAVDYLIKPFRAEELLEGIVKYAGRNI